MLGITTGTLLCQKVYTKCASAAHISKRIFRAHILYYKLGKLLEHLQSRGKLYTTLNLGPLANGVTICVSNSHFEDLLCENTFVKWFTNIFHRIIISKIEKTTNG